MSDYCCECQENAERIWNIGDDLAILSYQYHDSSVCCSYIYDECGEHI